MFARLCLLLSRHSGLVLKADLLAFHSNQAHRYSFPLILEILVFVCIVQ